MYAYVFDAECFGAFPEGVGDFFVVEKPGFFADLCAGVHLPGVDFEFFDLAFHLVEFFGAEVGTQETVREDALRAREVVDELAGGDHLVGREGVFVPVAAGDAADDGEHGIAIAEDFFDVMGAVEEVEGFACVFGFGAKAFEEVFGGLAGFGVVVPLAGHVDVMGLDVEDELVFGPFFFESHGVDGFDGVNFVGFAVDLIECDEGGGHAAGGAEIVAPGDALGFAGIVGDGVDAREVFFLGRRLGRRDEFFVRGDDGRNGGAFVVAGVNLALAHPHDGLASKFA